jgi:hypothetical protein
LRERNSLQPHITILVEFVKGYFVVRLVPETGEDRKKEEKLEEKRSLLNTV